jgi:CHAD domain-containing protein/CYTH domain-containing protein
LLQDARAARDRLKEGADGEALHDFRVALRRLRSVLRAFRPVLGDGLPQRLRRRLRNLARTTNAARDAEVLALWLEARLPGLAPAKRAGAKWLLAQLVDRREAGYGKSLEAIEQSFPGVARRVRRRLDAAVQTAAVAALPERSFGAVLGDLVAGHARILREHLEQIGAGDDAAAVHETRISAKRLRYLLELVAGEVPPALTAVDHLKNLQTLLGDLHDLQIADAECAAAVERAAADHARRLQGASRRARADERERRKLRRQNAGPGVQAVRRLALEAQLELREGFVGWHADDWATLDEALRRTVDDLARRAPSAIEIERKYLLRGLPALDPATEVVDVEQGWLPGRRLLERVRRVRSGRGEQYFRTVKLGDGLSRLEIEEETTGELFSHLWPLTEGRRVRKRRYYVADGALLWEIDEFVDRDLVLAEVELPSPETLVEVPSWLSEVLVRDVTGEVEYLNVTLAG